jgi:hypothetical protein
LVLSKCASRPRGSRAEELGGTSVLAKVEALVGNVRTTGLSTVSAAALNSDKPDGVDGLVGVAGE